MYQNQTKYIGNLAQLFGVKEYTLSGGRQNGVSAVDISCGNGLDLTVIADRCMDIYQLKFKGINLNYLSSTGIVAPTYYESEGANWMRSFFGGFLTTCGLTTIGTGSVDDGEALGIHGRIGNIPAEHFSTDISMVDGNPQVKLKGIMNESVMFGSCLSLTREITCNYNSNIIFLTDTVVNTGYRSAPHMILYHFNIGYPLLSESASLHIPTSAVTPRDEYAANMQSRRNIIDPPQPDARESCFYHDMESDEKGIVSVGVDNPSENIGIRIRYDKHALPYFVQWRMLGEGEYVTGLEPANAPIDGRDKARSQGCLPFINPGEKRIYRFEIEAYTL
ncbi:MAG: aldose 1-epimerase family protein [Oscillospiraceae bacterium]|nr:aldose 1-epimerase family protein [Oscillospiraceae bacterium]MDD4413076.1 aldose 1-epimerase family protein [Oscillospiraceae bacterium]